MDSDLLSNLDKLHTTEMGAERIRKNCAPDIADVVAWCKDKIQTAESIVRKGKNWYARSGGCTITVNAHSYTVITAHKDKGDRK